MRKQDFGPLFAKPEWKRMEQHHYPVPEETAFLNSGQIFSKALQSKAKKLGVEAGFVLEGWQASSTGCTLSPGDASAGAAPAQPSGGEDGEAGGCRHQGGER